MVKTYIFRYMYKKGLGLSQILLSSVKVTIKRIKTQNCNSKYSKQGKDSSFNMGCFFEFCSFFDNF